MKEIKLRIWNKRIGWVINGHFKNPELLDNK